MRSHPPLPGTAPNLPEGITDASLMSTWSTGDLFHYGNGRWARANKAFELASA